MDKVSPPCLGIVLAGGRSSRMGTDKAELRIGTATMMAVVSATLGAVADRVVVVGREVPTGVGDDHPGARGPLAGVATGMRIAGTGSVLAVAVDHPFLRTATLRALRLRWDGRQAVIPVDRGVPQVTCALYPAGWHSAAVAELGAGGSLSSLAARMGFDGVLDWREWGEDGRSWFGVDTPGDLRDGLARYGTPFSPEP